MGTLGLIRSLLWAFKAPYHPSPYPPKGPYDLGFMGWRLQGFQGIGLKAPVLYGFRF